MARAYDDDLRRKLLAAYDRGGATLGEWAERFGVSRGWAWKVSAQRKHSGQAERVRNRTGRKLRTPPEVQRQVIGWFATQPDLTLREVQERIERQARISLSLSRVWHLVRRLGLRLKKSRSMPPSATRKPTGSGGCRSSKPSAPSRRRS